MNYLVIVLRLLHIISGVFWVGGALMLTFFISPTVAATKDAGQGFMRYFMGNTKFSLAMWTAAIIAILAGFSLYWIDSHGFTSAWTHSGPGIGFGTAAGFALLGFITGIVTNRNSSAMAKLGGQIQSQGKPPSPEQAAQLQKLGKALATGGTLNAVFLILATLGMAISRYLQF